MHFLLNCIYLWILVTRYLQIKNTKYNQQINYYVLP